jgi:NADH-quinone oxidoreductase subunit C
MAGLVQEIRKRFLDALREVVEYQGETTLVLDPARAGDVLRLMKDEYGFDSLVDISSAHWPDEGLVDVVWFARSLASREQVRIKIRLPEEAAVAPSATGIWRAADWLEREVYDLMGVRFEGHPDLKRIMLPEDFEGHPLRKEFPMEGDDEWRNYLPQEETQR